MADLAKLIDPMKLRVHKAHYSISNRQVHVQS